MALAHLDLASTALHDFHVIQSNVSLAVKSDSFHHIDGFYISTIRR